MLSPALSGRSQVISSHLRDVGIFIYGTVGYLGYRGKELCVNKNERRPGGMMIVKQQGMEVLGVDLSPSESFKDRFAVRP
jgi:hypothetical protein